MVLSDKITFNLLVIIIVVIVFMGPRFTDRIPDPLLKLFINPYFRALVIFFSIYSIQNNILISILVTLCFLIVINRIDNNILFELFLNKTNPDSFQGDYFPIDNFTDYNNKEDFNEDEDDDDDYNTELLNKKGDNSINNQNIDKKYEGSSEMNKCSKLVKDYFPCNKRNRDNKCCSNENYDIMIKNENGETENVTQYMNEHLTGNNLIGLDNINTWCKNYRKNKQNVNLKYGCDKNSLLTKCANINKICDFSKEKKNKIEYDFSGTCGAIDENIHNQVCFDLNPKENKCKGFNKSECIKNKKDCFYIENNQFINSKIKKNNSIYKCKIPNKNDKLPENCFPVKLYKDTCGNVGMGCWVKDKEIDTVIPSAKIIPYKPKIKVYNKSSSIINKTLPTINYNSGNNIGSIRNNICRN